MNKFPLLSKTLIIGFLMLLLTIPLEMVSGVIRERSMNRTQATNEVARAHAGAQTLSGPVLHVPYTETFKRTVVVDVDKGTQREDTVVVSRVLTVFPLQTDTRSRLVTDTRKRGIFPVTVYTSHHETAGRFVWPGVTPKETGGQIKLGQPYVMMGVSDLRGLQSPPQLEIGGKSLPVGASPAGQQLPLPLAAPLQAGLLEVGAALDFTLALDLAGTGKIAWVPLADDNRLSLTSGWPHPSFGGDFLPRERDVGDAGFTASWRVPSLSTQAQQQFLNQGQEKGGRLDQMVVSLEDPVDVYRLSDRATKYGMMFIVLTFAAFFVMEVVKRWRIHPMQYLMIGAALVLFFLLLLSLSEHLGFGLAYLAASAACIGLMGHYLRHVLGGWRVSLVVSGMLVSLYGVLYGILISEDNALMMGSLLLFGVLAAIMVATRRLDWYGVMRAEAQPVSAASHAEA
ncbi:MAG: cell envelope integrity protein CreD [Burkholderiaceae bacterium]